VGYLLPYHLLYEVPPLEVVGVAMHVDDGGCGLVERHDALIAMAGRPHLQRPWIWMKSAVQLIRNGQS